VIDAIPTMYAMTTEKLYVGLWSRTTAQLRGELDLAGSENPRDHFGEYALIYTRLAEKLASDKLGQAELVPLIAAMEIVWAIPNGLSCSKRLVRGKMWCTPSPAASKHCELSSIWWANAGYVALRQWQQG
jgi:hypothetical protein